MVPDMELAQAAAIWCHDELMDTQLAAEGEVDDELFLSKDEVLLFIKYVKEKTKDKAGIKALNRHRAVLL